MRKRKTPIAMKLFLLVLILGFGLASCTAGNETTGSQPSGGAAESGTVRQTEQNPEDIAQAALINTFGIWQQAWQTGDYAAMYRLLSAESTALIDETAFVTRYQNIFTGIEAADLIITLVNDHLERPVAENERVVQFTINLTTLAGPIELTDYEMTMVNTGTPGQPVWQIKWHESLIIPHMQPTDKVQARTLYPRRGEIYDRNHQPLAINGELRVIGIVPERFVPVRDTAVPQMAEWLGISEDSINRIVDQATVSDWFYPVVTLSADQSELSAQLTSLDGVQYQTRQGRIYPGGIAAGLLTGYTGPITAEELEQHQADGYLATDQIGKMGLELAFEQRLRGQRGGEIYLIDGDSGRVVREVARLEPVHGETIRLTIDLAAQQALYQQLQQDAGAAAAINPQTGEILAFVSSPSFDPNVFQTYVPDSLRQQWNESEKSFFLNRANSGYAPGSTFKLVTSAIGLRAGTLIPDEVVPISGLHWQPDNSWGQYRITRVRDSGPVNLEQAIITSDNIYFAMQALRFGRSAFETDAVRFGIGIDLPATYPFYRAQLSNEGLTRETLVADTGYGQGEILLTPLHMAMIYGALATDGDIIMPLFEIDPAGTETSVWQAQAIRSEDVGLLRDIFTLVVDSPSGSGYTDPPAVRGMLGKTGTAELKATLDDDEANENGWFVAVDTEEGRLAIAMIVEDVKGRGGSHYVVPLVKQAMDQLLLP